MHNARQQGHVVADHAHLRRRVVARKLQARAEGLHSARSPQRLGDFIDGIREDIREGINRGLGRGGGGGDNDRGGRGGGRGNDNGNDNGNGGGGGRGGGRDDDNDRGNPGTTSAARPAPTQSAPPASSSFAPPPQAAPVWSDNNGGNGNGGGGSGGGNNDGGSDSGGNNNGGDNSGQRNGDKKTPVETSSSASSETSVVRGGVLGANPSSGTPTAVIDSNPNSTTAGGPTNNPTVLPAPSGAARSGLSGPVIATIVVVCLLLLLLLLALLIRRRWVARRRDRMQQWWSSRKRTSQSYDDDKMAAYPTFNEKSTFSAPSPSPAPMDAPPSPLDFSTIVPVAPPLAELRERHGSGHHNQTAADRFSIGSASSDGSDGSHFVVHHPMKRLSQTESFKFPKPPSVIPTEAPSVHSRSGSGNSNLTAASNTSLAVAYHGAASTASSLSKPLPMPPSGLSRPPIVPDSDTAPMVVAPLSFKSKSSSDKIPNPFLDSGDRYAPSIYNHNPFDDDQALAMVGNFADVETIRRPYEATLTDELEVTVGDSVRVMEIFDDGWAMVEKIVQNSPKGKAPERVPPPTGLIPIACLRDATQDLSTFLNTKHVQSFRVSNQTTE